MAESGFFCCIEVGFSIMPLAAKLNAKWCIATDATDVCSISMLSFANVLLLKDFTCSLLHTVMWKGMFMFYAAYLLIIFDNQPISF